MRNTLDACAERYGLAGDVQVRIELDRFGKIIAIDSEYGDAFAGCVGNALLTARYRDHANHALMISFTPLRS